MKYIWIYFIMLCCNINAQITLYDIEGWGIMDGVTKLCYKETVTQMPPTREIIDTCLKNYGNIISDEVVDYGSTGPIRKPVEHSAYSLYAAGKLNIDIKSKTIVTISTLEELDSKVNKIPNILWYMRLYVKLYLKEMGDKLNFTQLQLQQLKEMNADIAYLYLHNAKSKVENEKRIDIKMKELETKLFSLQEQELKRMHQRLEFGHRLRLLRYAMAELTGMFLPQEIQYKGYNIFSATIPSVVPEYRKKSILSRIQDIKDLWSSLLENKKEGSQLSDDLKEFEVLSHSYSQISIQEEGKKENLLNLLKE